MKDISREMIKEFKIMKLGYDFMGYKVKRKESLSFHHLVVAHKDSKRMGIPNDGYVRWNGAILVQETSHNYLHTIERVDFEIFSMLSSEMIDMNIKGKLDNTNLKQIRAILEYFESEHRNDRTKKGKMLIKREYLRERVEI